MTAAAASAKFPPNTDFRVSITNAPGAESYPISSFTWLLVRPEDRMRPRPGAKNFLEWMLTERRSRWPPSCITLRCPPVVAVEQSSLRENHDLECQDRAATAPAIALTLT